MSAKRPKLPKSGGALRARQTIKKFRSQQPSDELVKIISEYGNEKNFNESTKKPVAVKDVEI
jgi:hypothetical protein